LETSGCAHRLCLSLKPFQLTLFVTFFKVDNGVEALVVDVGDGIFDTPRRAFMVSAVSLGLSKLGRLLMLRLLGLKAGERCTVCCI
jgi:hypothetical protein